MTQSARRLVSAATGRQTVPRVVGIGLGSGLLYVAMYLTQRAIHDGPGGAFAAGLVL
jgi:hypothetical protein